MKFLDTNVLAFVNVERTDYQNNLAHIHGHVDQNIVVFIIRILKYIGLIASLFNMTKWVPKLGTRTSVLQKKKQASI
jgi:hypothetical protein